MKKALKELEENFKSYTPLWQEWVTYKYSGLSSEDIYIIEVHSTNHFEITANDTLMFYNQPKKIMEVTAKLKANYPEFQNWVLSRFFIVLVQTTIKGKRTAFIETRIRQLKISSALKRSFLSFGHATIQEVIETYSETDFKQPLFFNAVLKCLFLLENKNTKNLNLSQTNV